MSRKRTNITEVKAGRIDLSEWELDAFNKIEDAINSAIRPQLERAVGEAVKLCFEDQDTYACLPIYWAPKSDGYSNPAVADPLTVDLRFALIYDGEYPTYRFSFADLVRDQFINSENAESKHPADIAYNRERGSLVAIALRALADELDA